MSSTAERRVFDVDIDVGTKTKREQYGVRAMIYNSDLEKVMPHPSGVYLEQVPVDTETGLCAFDYEYGNTKGFAKVDILTNTAYDAFSSKSELLDAIEQPVDWNLLNDEEFVSKLPHIGKHFDVIQMIRPSTVEELADVLALIRPAKLKYLQQYRKNQRLVRKNLYLRPVDDGIYFKKSHAVSYALMIVAVMNKRSNAGIVYR